MKKSYLYIGLAVTLLVLVFFWNRNRDAELNRQADAHNRAILEAAGHAAPVGEGVPDVPPITASTTVTTDGMTTAEAAELGLRLYDYHYQPWLARYTAALDNYSQLDALCARAATDYLSSTAMECVDQRERCSQRRLFHRCYTVTACYKWDYTADAVDNAQIVRELCALRMGAEFATAAISMPSLEIIAGAINISSGDTADSETARTSDAITQTDSELPSTTEVPVGSASDILSYRASVEGGGTLSSQPALSNILGITPDPNGQAAAGGVETGSMTSIISRYSMNRGVKVGLIIREQGSVIDETLVIDYQPPTSLIPHRYDSDMINAMDVVADILMFRRNRRNADTVNAAVINDVISDLASNGSVILEGFASVSVPTSGDVTVESVQKVNLSPTIVLGTGESQKTYEVRGLLFGDAALASVITGVQEEAAQAAYQDALNESANFEVDEWGYPDNLYDPPSPTSYIAGRSLIKVVGVPTVSKKFSLNLTDLTYVRSV